MSKSPMKRRRPALGVAAITVVTLIAAGCTTAPSSPAPVMEHFCDLWSDVEADPTPSEDAVLVDDGLVARAETASTHGQDCNDPSARVLLDEAELAEGDLVEGEEGPPEGVDPQSMSLRSGSDGEDPAPTGPTAVITGERISKGKDLLDNLRLRSISAWIDHRGITVTGAVDVSLEGVPSTIGYTGTFSDVDNWSIHLSSTAFSIPGITTTPATFSGALVMNGGQPSLTLTAAAAEVEIGDITVRSALLDFSLDSETGLSAYIAGEVEVGRNAFDGEVHVVLDASGNLVSADARVGASLTGWQVGGVRVELDGEVTFTGNTERSLVTFSGSGRIGEVVVHNANGSLEFDRGVVTFEGEVDVTYGENRVRMNGRIIFDEDGNVEVPLLDLEAAGEFSAVLDSGEVVEVKGLVSTETGLGGTYAVVTGTFTIGAIEATGSARIETDYNRTTLQVIEAQIDVAGVAQGGQLSGYVVIEDGVAVDVNFEASMESMTFGRLSLLGPTMSITSTYNGGLDVALVSDLTVNGDMVTASIDAEARFDADGLLWLRTNTAEVDLELDGDMRIHGEADLTVEAGDLTVALDGELVSGVGLDVDLGGTLEADLESGEADWNFLGVADVSYGRFTASNVEIQISPNIEAQSIDFEVFWDWKTAGRVGVWVTGKFFLAADGIDRMNIGTSFGALIDSIAAEAIQGVVPFPVHAVTNIQTGWVYA
ncbi:MAG: hypothetical protein KDB15_15840 [Microthrixaceae bacterium]|nr:hypothetical protein [Microthrixaceae bacterium]